MLKRLLLVLTILLLISTVGLSACTPESWRTYTYDAEWTVEYPTYCTVQMDKGLEAHPFEYIVYFQSSKWWLEVGWSGGPLPPYAFWDMAARKVIIKDSGYYELDLLDNSLIEKEIENQKNGMGIERYWITGHPNPEIQKIYEKFSSSFRLIN